MIFVDKSLPHELEADILNFLNVNWIEKEESYLNLSFERLKQFIGSDRLIGSLSAFQDDVCVYCNLPVNEKTVEHVIPQNADYDECEWYISLRVFKDNLVHSGMFEKHRKQVNHFPHNLAYGNLVVACARCNNNRKSKRLYPVFLHRKYKVQIEILEKDGQIRVDGDLGRELFDQFNKPKLRAIRKSLLPYIHEAELNLNKLIESKKDDLLWQRDVGKDFDFSRLFPLYGSIRDGLDNGFISII